MTRIFDQPEDFAAAALAGFCSAHADHVLAAPHGALRAQAAPPGKVALVVGGGSGHYPAFLGYIGHGLADAAVAGDVFASPSTNSVMALAMQADVGGGVILGFGNYAGDVLHFGAAAERLRAQGIDTRILAVTDDVASAPPAEATKRRGIAGDLVVFKIAGAAAEVGWDLDAVDAIGKRANAATVSFGVAFSGCTLPGQEAPLFRVEADQAALGLGIHGEPGIDSRPMPAAAELAQILLDRLLAERPADHAGRVAVVLNGLGCSKHEELFVLWHQLSGLMDQAGLVPVQPAIGEFVTSLDMAGCSLTLCWLDPQLEEFWVAPVDAPVLRRGVLQPASAQARRQLRARSGDAALRQGSPVSRAMAVVLAERIQDLAQALAEAETELGRIDAQAGDGDHGQGMARGSAAAAEIARETVANGAGLATLLAKAGDAWADRAGGTSGALWGAGLRAAGDALDDESSVSPEAVACAARAALDAITGLGGAERGDKTLVDALIPFVETLEARINAGAPVSEAWQAAAAAATEAAEATAEMIPRKGRARPLAERSLGHPDAGAISLALSARAMQPR